LSARILDSRSVCEVNITTGMLCVPEPFLRREHVSKPSILGMDISRRMMSGCTAFARSSPSMPFDADSTRNPRLVRIAPRMSTTSA
jgi:hypothetical protein